MVLLLFLCAATLYTIAWGRLTRIAAKSHTIINLTNFVMRYSRSRFDPIRAYLIWGLYVFTGLVGAVVILLIFRINLLRYITMGLNEVAFIPLALIAQLSISSLILMLIALVQPGTNWFAVLQSIEWVQISQLLPKIVSILYPLTGAFAEEIFFRGVIFLTLVEVFPQVGIIVAVVITTVLFTLQQVLNVKSWSQVLLISIGSITISTVNCLVMLKTQSFLPALICHELYALLFLALRQGSPGANQRPIKSAHAERSTHF